MSAADRRLAHALTLACQLADELERARMACAAGADRACLRALSRDFRRTHAIADTLVRDLYRAPERLPARDFTRARALAWDLARAHAFAIDPDLSQDLSRVHALAADIERALGSWRDPHSSATPAHSCGVSIAPGAARFLITATCLLPAPDRVRYREEYRSELREIAASGANPRQQFQYVARQSLRAGHLRRAVLAPRRRRALP